MRQFTLLLLLAAFALPVQAGGEVKEVCRMTKKDGKEVKTCKKVKVHKKLEGTKVPPK